MPRRGRARLVQPQALHAEKGPRSPRMEPAPLGDQPRREDGELVEVGKVGGKRERALSRNSERGDEAVAVSDTEEKTAIHPT